MSTTNTAKSLAGFVSLALALMVWRSPGCGEALSGLIGGYRSIVDLTADYGPGGYSPAYMHPKSAFICATVLEGAYPRAYFTSPTPRCVAGQRSRLDLRTAQMGRRGQQRSVAEPAPDAAGPARQITPHLPD